MRSQMLFPIRPTQIFFIDRLEVHINTIVKKGAYITLTHPTIIKYVNINLR